MMRELGRFAFVLPLIGFVIAGESSCGARSTLSGDLAPGDTGGGGQGGGGGAGTTSSKSTTSSVVSTTVSSSSSSGGISHPVISDSPGSFIQAETSVARSPKGFVAVAWIDIKMNGKSTIGY